MLSGSRYHGDRDGATTLDGLVVTETTTFNQDRVPNARPVVLISDGLWHRRFGGDPVVVGRIISINGHPFTVLGVLPPS